MIDKFTDIKLKEIFLDGLVNRALQLQFMKGQRELFLELAPHHQDDYFLDVLKISLKVPKLKDGSLYVITRDSAFQYEKKSERAQDNSSTHDISNTRYTIPAKFDIEEGKVPDDAIARTGKPFAQVTEEPKFSGVGSFDEMLRHWADEYTKQKDAYGSAKPFRVLFFDEESKKSFYAAAQNHGFAAVPRTAPYHGFEKLNIYLYSKD